MIQDYLSYTFQDTPEQVNAYDELPLWSAYFGMQLLDNLEYLTGLSILDIGSGTGFPLLEIASRFGESCHCYGLDSWPNANARARMKCEQYGVKNVTIIDGSADRIELSDSSMDLVVSNLGINNFQNRDAVFAECFRVLKKGGKLAITTNLDGHWQEFYDIFCTTLVEMKLNHLLPTLKAHCAHRGSMASVSEMFVQAGFIVSRQTKSRFQMRFANGSAFLNHHFIKLGWMSGWKELLQGENIPAFFARLEEKLNQTAKEEPLTFSVPVLFIQGVKV